MAEFLISISVVIALFATAYFLAPKGWRTRFFNWSAGGLAGAHVLLEQLQELPWSEALPPQIYLAVMVGITIANWVLREVTTTPPGQADA